MAHKKLTELLVIKDDDLLSFILKEAEKEPRLYVLVMFLLHTGMPLIELIKLTVSDVCGNSFYIKKHKRLFIYGESFSIYLDRYINAFCQDGKLLFPGTNRNEPMAQPDASSMVIRFFRDLGYHGSASTFTKTYLYYYAKEYGSLTSITPKARTSYWINTTLFMSFDEYKAFRDIEAPPDVLNNVEELLGMCSKEYHHLLSDPNTDKEMINDINQQLLDVYKALVKTVSTPFL